MLFYLKEDRKNPEPKGKIAQAFIMGMLATIPAAILELALSCAFGYDCAFYSDFPLYYNKLLDNPLLLKIISIFLIIAATEEFFKYLVIRSEVLRNKEFDEAIDAMIYSIVISLGFASAENALYTFIYGGNPIYTVLERFFTAVLIHALAGGIIGYHIGLIKLEEIKQHQFLPGIKKSKKSSRIIAKGVCLAILLHGTYNLLISFNSRTSLLVIFALIIFTALLISLAFDKLKNCYVAINNSFIYNKYK